MENFILVRFCIILLFIIKSQVLGKQQTHFVRLCVILIHKGIRRDVICNELYWATCETKNQSEKQKVFFWQHQHVKTKSWKSPKNFLSSLREKFRQYNRPWKSFKWKRKSYKARFYDSAVSWVYNLLSTIDTIYKYDYPKNSYFCINLGFPWLLPC